MNKKNLVVLVAIVALVLAQLACVSDYGGTFGNGGKGDAGCIGLEQNWDSCMERVHQPAPGSGTINKINDWLVEEFSK